MQFPILQLLAKRDKAVINRHPWIFSGALKSKVNAREGAIVEVQNNEGNTLGFGFYSAESQISCRMFDWDQNPGAFHTVEYWKIKIEKSLKLRQEITINSSTNAYRLLHAEGDFLPGIIVDVYNNTLVIQINIVGVEIIKDLLFEAFKQLGFSEIYIKAKLNYKNEEEISKVQDESKSILPIEIIENGLKFSVDIFGGQKTGFFIDQRDNRQLLREISKDKIVLNAFSYTGGFSIYSLSGGAAEVHSLDISKDAIEGADQNARLNNLQKNHHLICQDCFEYLKLMPSNKFDIIVLDPPAFAKHSRAVDNAAKGYKQINMKAIQKIRTGGLILTFSCSQHISKELFQKIIFGAAADVKRNVRILRQLHQPADHPISIFHPEGEYLKGLLLWVE